MKTTLLPKVIFFLSWSEDDSNRFSVSIENQIYFYNCTFEILKFS
jgi:hypothetical protein